VREESQNDLAVPSDLLRRLLAERAERQRGVTPQTPTRVPASRFKDYITDYDGTVRGLTRPMPERPYRQTRLGTLFHAWVEHRSGLVGTAPSPESALWEIDGDQADIWNASAADAADLEQLRAIFERSEWAQLAPIAVEIEIDFTLGGHIIICKLDAVYRREDRGGRIEIVDWKTGKAPRTAAERDERMLQLALY